MDWIDNKRRSVFFCYINYRADEDWSGMLFCYSQVNSAKREDGWKAIVFILEID